MEQITKSKPSHPNIIGYYGCRVRRGRITAIFMERHDQTLMQYAFTPEFQNLDKIKFYDALESAVTYLHSLGLAHNDISPYKIMVKKDGMPALIDFGSSGPFGKRLPSLGSPGWYEQPFFTSDKKNDFYSLNNLREWLQQPSSFPPALNAS